MLTKHPVNQKVKEADEKAEELWGKIHVIIRALEDLKSIKMIDEEFFKEVREKLHEAHRNHHRYWVAPFKKQDYDDIAPSLLYLMKTLSDRTKSLLDHETKQT